MENIPENSEYSPPASTYLYKINQAKPQVDINFLIYSHFLDALLVPRDLQFDITLPQLTDFLSKPQ